MSTGKARMGASFGVMLLLLMIGSLLAATLRQSHTEFHIGDYSGADLPAAQAAFEESQDNGDLVTLVNILCYRWKVQGDEAAKSDMAHYGAVLLARAKAGEIDLEKAGDPEEMLQVLAAIREVGVQ